MKSLSFIIIERFYLNFLFDWKNNVSKETQTYPDKVQIVTDVITVVSWEDRPLFTKPSAEHEKLACFSFYFVSIRCFHFFTKLCTTMSLKLAIILVVSLQVNSKVVPQNPGHNAQRFQTPLVGPGPYNEHLERVFEALQKLIVFYNKEYKNLLVDGVYGLRVLEGRFWEILKINLICSY